MSSRPPRDAAELFSRAEALAGRSLGDIANELGWPVPTDPARAKGWAGQLVEAVLGASAGSRPAPDFEHLGIELKTLPVRADGRPRESTFVCNVELLHDETPRWETSRARHKLGCVLFVPVVTPDATPLGERLVGMPLPWRMDVAWEAALRADWEELMDLVCLDGATRISAEHGDWLQIRPKGPNARARRRGVDAEGRAVDVLPLGFYLRAGFTARLLASAYADTAPPEGPTIGA